MPPVGAVFSCKDRSDELGALRPFLGRADLAENFRRAGRADVERGVPRQLISAQRRQICNRQGVDYDRSASVLEAFERFGWKQAQPDTTRDRTARARELDKGAVWVVREDEDLDGLDGDVAMRLRVAHLEGEEAFALRRSFGRFGHLDVLNFGQDVCGRWRLRDSRSLRLAKRLREQHAAVRNTHQCEYGCLLSGARKTASNSRYEHDVLLCLHRHVHSSSTLRLADYLLNNHKQTANLRITSI